MKINVATAAILLLCNAGFIFAQSLPAGYTSVYARDYNTSATTSTYLGADNWYFYDGGSATDRNNPEFDRRFEIITDPLNGTNKCLRLTKFDGDRDYSNSNLNPRTEISMRPSNERSIAKEIYFSIKTYFPQDQANVFSAEFIQFWLHGSSNIPMQIEVRNGQFAARRPGEYRVPDCANCGFGKMLNQNLGRWITWEVRARFTNTNGYWLIYMDGDLVFTHTGKISDWPSNTGTWHPQYGAYANNGGAGKMEVYFDDLQIAEYTGIIAPSSSSVIPSSSSISSSSTIPAQTPQLTLSLWDASADTVFSAWDDIQNGDNIPAHLLNTTEFTLTAQVLNKDQTIAFTHLRFDWNGTQNYRTEANAPYALAGDGAGDDLFTAPIAGGAQSFNLVLLNNGTEVYSRSVDFNFNLNTPVSLACHLNDGCAKTGSSYLTPASQYKMRSFTSNFFQTQNPSGTLSIYNPTGELVYQGAFSGYQVIVPNLQSGYYLVREVPVW
jgi:hypothetical protein